MAAKNGKLAGMKLYRRAALVLFLSGSMAGCATMDSPPPPHGALVDVASAAPEPVDMGPETTVSGLYMAGNAALRDGRADAASRFYERAVDMAPDEDKAYLRERTFQAAIMGGDIERAVRVAPTDPEADAYRLGRLVLAVDALARGEGQTAYDILTSESLGPRYRPAVDLVRPWAALAAGQTAAATGPRVVLDSPDQAVAALNQALILEAAGQPQEAGPIYAGLSSRAPGGAYYALAHGGYLERQGLRREALALYDAILADDPRNTLVERARTRAGKRGAPAPALPSVREGAGRALLVSAKRSLDQRDIETGVAYLRLSLRLDPDAAEALLMAGVYLTAVGDAAGARAAYDRIEVGAPEYLIAQARIIEGYQKAGDTAAALRRAQALAQHAPRDLGAKVLLADLLRAAEDYQGSARVLTEVIDQRGKAAEWSLYYARAISRQMANDWPGAEKDLLHARALAPEEPDVLNYLGYSWADRGERLGEALALLKTAAAKSPNSGAIIDSLGWAYFKVGDLEKAVENLERAVELEPSAADINDHLGDVYAAVGRSLEARYQWQRVLTLEASDELKARAQAKIDATPEPAPIVAASLLPATATP